MFVWGGYNKTVEQPAHEVRPCKLCQKPRDMDLFLNYRANHVWYLFRWITAKKYYWVCPTCKGITPSSANEARQKQGRPTVSPVDRFGWIAGVLIVAGLVGYFYYADALQRNHDLVYLSHPTVGDIYQVNLQKFSKRSEDATLEGLIEVTAVRPDGIHVRMSRFFTSDQNRLAGDVSSGRAGRDEYYSLGDGLVQVGQLAELRRSGGIDRVYPSDRRNA